VVAARVSHRAWGGPWLGARVADIGEERRGLVRFLAWTNLGSLVGLLGKEADALVLGLARGATDVGYYRFARSAAAVAGSLVGPLQSVAYRRFAALHGAGDREGIGRAARRASMRAAIPLGLLMLAALPFVPFAVRLVGGDAYRPAAGAAQVLLVGAALWMCFFWIRPLLLTLGDVREVAVANAVAALLAFAGYLAFAGGFGATGVAAAQTAAAAAGWLLLVRHLARRHEGLLGGRAVGPSEVRDAFLP
jgi:O-antigen/teichoic acid export membrane protein